MSNSTKYAFFNLTVAAMLLAALPTMCLAMMSIETVTRERAKELGLEIRVGPAGPDAMRIELEFPIKGELKDYRRVDLDVRDGGKLGVTSTLREDKARPGRVVVSFAADRSNLDKLSLKVVTTSGAREFSGYVIRLKDFVDLNTIR